MIEAKRVRANDHRNTSEESESLDYEGGSPDRLCRHSYNVPSFCVECL